MGLGRRRGGQREGAMACRPRRAPWAACRPPAAATCRLRQLRRDLVLRIAMGSLPSEGLLTY